MMNREELKKTLIEQAEPFAQAVARKMSELQEDSDLEDDEATELGKDFDYSLYEAFGSSEKSAPLPDYKDSEIKGTFEYYSEQSAKPHYIGEEPNEQSITQHKENIAAKIAALRGISLPGDYLNKRS